jgi:hypothetical protein
MDEHVFAASVGLNKSITLCRVEPLCRHVVSPQRILKPDRMLTEFRRVMTTLMRNGRDRRLEKPVKCHARKERVFLVGTRSADHIRAGGHSGCIQRPDTWLHPKASLKCQIPLAPRAPSIHGTFETCRGDLIMSDVRGRPEVTRNRPNRREGPIPDLQRFGALPSAALLIRPLRPGNLLVGGSTAQFTQESLGLPQVKRI